MDIRGYAYFVERPRRLEDLLRPHLIERERPYSIVTAVQLPKIDYENFVTDMLADRCMGLPAGAAAWPRGRCAGAAGTGLFCLVGGVCVCG